MMCARVLFASLYRCKYVPFLLAAGAGLFLFPLFAAPVSAQVLINELYYDHPGADAGFEFIELINTSDSVLCLDRCSIEFHNGAGEGWVEIWSGSVRDSLPADGLFLIGDELVEPPPHSLVALAIQNGPDAIRLLWGGVPLDLLGYGDLDHPSDYEGEAGVDVDSGFSLGRVPDGSDTNNNAADFTELHPSPGSFNIPRNDLSISFDGAIERVVGPDDDAAIACVVRNHGLFGVAGAGYTAEVWDSTRYSVGLLQSFDGHRLEAGAQRRFEIRAALDRGYHWVTGRVRFAGDERQENDIASLVLRSGSPQVLISEVMSYPPGECPQYIELFNCGANAVDCDGWLVRDGAHRYAPISADPVRIDPGACAVLTSDKTLLLQYFPSMNPDRVLQMDGAWPYLNHTGSGESADSVVLADQFGLAVDRIAYPPQESALRGFSLERADLYPGLGAHTWIVSSSPFGGTPGEQNSVFMESPPSGGSLSCSPNPFSLRDETLLIAVSSGDEVERVVVSVYDANGKRLREIGSAAAVPALFVWDARRRDGNLVSPGIYIVVCEKFLRGGGKRVERVVVGCGTKRFQKE